MNVHEHATDDQNSTSNRARSGIATRVDPTPDEIRIELRAGSPAYIHVREGDYLQEGDAFHREQLGMAAPTLETWKIIEITPERVTGRELTAGETVTMDRTTVERGLAVGRFSTNLTDFEWVTVYRVGRRAIGSGETGDTRQPDHQYVSVVAYGDNGQKYGRRYRFDTPESRELYLWREDKPLRGFSDAVADRLERRVRKALEAEGYTVVDRPSPST